MTEAVLDAPMQSACRQITKNRKRSLESLASVHYLDIALEDYDKVRDWYLPMKDVLAEVEKVAALRADIRGSCERIRESFDSTQYLHVLSIFFLDHMNVDRPDADLGKLLERFDVEVRSARQTLSYAITHTQLRTARENIEHMLNNNPPEAEIRFWRTMHFGYSRFAETMFYEHIAARVRRFDELMSNDPERARRYMGSVPENPLLDTLRNLAALSNDDLGKLKKGEMEHSTKLVELDPALLASYIRADNDLYRRILGEFEVITSVKKVAPAARETGAMVVKEPTLQDINYKGLKEAFASCKNGIPNSLGVTERIDNSARSLAYCGHASDAAANEFRRALKRFKFSGNRHHFAIFLERIENYVGEKRSFPDQEALNLMQGEVLKLGTEKEYRPRT